MVGCPGHILESTKEIDFLFFYIFFIFSVRLCRFCMVIRFFHPRHNGQWPPTSKDFFTRSYPFYYFRILILLKEPVIPFSMLSAKQGNYWYHFYNVFGMTRSLTGDWTRDLPHSTTRLSRRRYCTDITFWSFSDVNELVWAFCFCTVWHQ